ncbi:MAG: TIR domain-containing protein [Frankia sp.]
MTSAEISGAEPGIPEPSPGHDFLINYVTTDMPWAVWIGWNLERRGFRVVLDAWDRPPGSNVIKYMNESIAGTRHTIVVLSPEYLESSHVTYWQAALLDDPDGAKKRLVPVRVAPCHPGGLMRGIPSLDLFDLDPDEARERLVRTASWVLDGGSIIPSLEPPFLAPAVPGSPRSTGPEAPVRSAEPDRPADRARSAHLELSTATPATVASAISRPAHPRLPVPVSDRAVPGAREPVWPAAPATTEHWAAGSGDSGGSAGLAGLAARPALVPLVAVVGAAIGGGTAAQAAGVAGGTVMGSLAAALAATVLGLLLLRSSRGVARFSVAVAAAGGSLAGVVGSGAARSGPVASATIEVGAAAALAVVYALILRPAPLPRPREPRSGEPLPRQPRPHPDGDEPTRPGRSKIFISYSHQDRPWLDRVLVHLKPLVSAGEIDVWSDRKLRGGDAWRTEISRSLGQAQVAILLISPTYLASDFIAWEELPPLLRAAQTGGCRIIPVLVRSSIFERTELARFQAHNSPRRPLAAMAEDEAEGCLVRLALDVWPTPEEPIRL